MAPRGANVAGVCGAVLVALVDWLLPGSGTAGALVAAASVLAVAAVVGAVLFVPRGVGRELVAVGPSPAGDGDQERAAAVQRAAATPAGGAF
jgi:hypothetical protein